MKKEFDLASLNLYPKPQSPNFEKAMKNASSKYDKIKEAIKILLENYEKDRHDFNIRTSQKVSKVFLKNNLENIKEILTDDTTIEDFVSALNITIGSLTLTTETDREHIKDYILSNIKKILKNEEEETENKPAYISVETLEETKEKIKDSIISTNSALITPKINALNNSIKVNSAIIASTISSISKLNLKLHGTTLKLRLMKLKNSVLGTASKVIGATKNFFKRGWASVVTAFKWVGKAIVTSLVAIGKGLSKLLGGIFKFVGRIFTGVIVGVMSLVTGVFGLLFKGLMVIVGGLFFIFRMAIKAVTLALGIIGGIVFWAVKGVFKTVSWIVGGVKDLLEAHKSLVKKAIKGIFATLGVFFLTPKGAYFLGLIAGFTWKYIILPISGGVLKAYQIIIDAKNKLVNWVSGLFKPGDENEGMTDEEQTSIIETVKTSIQSSDWFISLTGHLQKVINFSKTIVDNLWGSLIEATHFISEIPQMLAGYGTMLGGALVGTYIGRLIGLYFGLFGSILGSSIGAIVGGTIGYLFEKNKNARFNKIKNIFVELEEKGLQKNIQLTGSRSAIIQSPEKKAKRSFLQKAMQNGAIPKEQQFKYSEKDLQSIFEHVEKAKAQPSLAQTRNVGEYFNQYRSAMASSIEMKGKLGAIQGFSIDKSKNYMEESIRTEFQSILSSVTGGDRDSILLEEAKTLFNSAKTDLMSKFNMNPFIVNRLNQFTWNPQNTTSDTLAEELVNQVYSMFGLTTYLMLVQGLTASYFTKFRFLDSGRDEDNPYSAIMWTLMFAKNNEIFNKVDVTDWHKFYSKWHDSFGDNEFDVSNPDVLALFSTKNQEKRALYLSTYLEKMMLGNLSNEDLNVNHIETELKVLLGEKYPEFIKFTEVKNGNMTFPLFDGIQQIFERYFDQFNIQDSDVKAAIINEVFARCLTKANPDFASAFFNDNGNEIMAKILSSFSVQNIQNELENLKASGETLQRTQTELSELSNYDFGNISKKNEAELEKSFNVVIGKMLEDKRFDSKEQEKLEEVMRKFPESGVAKIIKKILEKLKSSGEVEQSAAESMLIFIEQQSDSAKDESETITQYGNQITVEYV